MNPYRQRNVSFGDKLKRKYCGSVIHLKICVIRWSDSLPALDTDQTHSFEWIKTHLQWLEEEIKLLISRLTTAISKDRSEWERIQPAVKDTDKKSTPREKQYERAEIHYQMFIDPRELAKFKGGWKFGPITTSPDLDEEYPNPQLWEDFQHDFLEVIAEITYLTLTLAESILLVHEDNRRDFQFRLCHGRTIISELEQFYSITEAFVSRIFFPETKLTRSRLLIENILLKKQSLCLVCGEAARQVLTLPCAHLLLCKKCSPALTRCVLCKEPFRGIVDVFRT